MCCVYDPAATEALKTSFRNGKIRLWKKYDRGPRGGLAPV